MSRVSTMLGHLRRFGATQASVLAAVAGLPDSGRVSALLKARIERGQIEKAGNKWQLNPDWTEEMAAELRDARIILERAGYRVIPPGARQ
jgi:hypothetical protein